MFYNGAIHTELEQVRSEVIALADLLVYRKGITPELEQEET